MPLVTPGLRPLFVLSLPRSGSTLVQRVLSAHDGIATTPEPWLALPQFYALRPLAADAEYDHRMMAGAVAQFAASLDGGLSTYLEHVRQFLLGLYEAASPEGTRWFVDKTPRYHLVAEELARSFPDARFVLLWRSPLAVLASMTRTWDSGHWLPWRHGIDLFTGVEELVRASDLLGDRAVRVRYEDLVSSATAWEPVFEPLGVTPNPDVFDRIGQVRLESRFGDPAQGRYAQVSDASLDRWRATLGSPVRTAWARRYLDWLGAERATTMGYDLAQLRHDLAGVDTSAWLGLQDRAVGARERLRTAQRRWRGEGPIHRDWPQGAWPWTGRPPHHPRGPGVDTPEVPTRVARPGP